MIDAPATAEQPTPTTSDRPAIADLVLGDIRARDELGKARYGTRLQAHNGRVAVVDAYQEVLDLAFYLRQEIEERKATDALVSAVRGWRKAVCDTQSCETDDLTVAAAAGECAGDTHDEACPVEIARLAMLEAHDRIEDLAKAGR